MKKVFAFLMMAVALFACTREEQPRTETPDQPESPATYTLTIQAAKGQDTRALALDGNTLNATWGATDQVLVYLNGNPDQVIATLTPDLNGQTDPASCLLKGDFTQLPAAGSILTLKLNSDNYFDQRGTLAYIADHCDYAVATLHVTGVENGKIQSTEGSANFESKQAIVKFSLKNDAGTAAIKPTSLTVQVDGTTVATVNQIDAGTYSTNGADGVLFVALPAASGAISLSATDGENSYTYTRTGVSFTAGKYYSITVKMATASNSYDLNNENLYVNGLFTAQNGAVLTGTFPEAYGRRVRIADGATITLRNATIVNSSTHFAGIALDGSATIILEGSNTIGSGSNFAGISIGGSSSTLTITGSGTLTATGGWRAAGIGSDCANSGTVVTCGSIIIDGGTVKATGGSGGAGIGCGYALDNAEIHFGSITINGGSVEANGVDGGTGIGGGKVGSNAVSACGDITISTPAQVKAETTGNRAPYSIGPSAGGSCSSVTIYEHLYWGEGASAQDAAKLSASPLVIPFS